MGFTLFFGILLFDVGFVFGCFWNSKRNHDSFNQSETVKTNVKEVSEKEKRQADYLKADFEFLNNFNGEEKERE